MIRENLNTVQENIRHACKRVGRPPEDVTLIAVSKTKPVEMIMEAYEAGIRDFGENKVQELMDKIPQLPSDIRWHMIGHLQRNKVKYIVGRTALIHSVDTYRLAEEINIQAKKKRIVVPILVEVNIAHEESKFGISAEDAILLGGGIITGSVPHHQTVVCLIALLRFGDALGFVACFLATDGRDQRQQVMFGPLAHQRFSSGGGHDHNIRLAG